MLHTILDLARHKPGSVAYIVTLEPIRPGTTVPEPWMAQSHPKVLFERGVCHTGWKLQHRHLPHTDIPSFQSLSHLLTGTLVVHEFQVERVWRDHGSGEMYYADQQGRHLPESSLFDSVASARAERDRIKKLVLQWVENRL